MQWRADSPHVVETSADMFFSQEEVSVCNVFSSCVLIIFLLINVE